MTSHILRSTVAAIAFAGALAFAAPSMAAMVNFKANLKRQDRSARQYDSRHRHGHRDL